jgi:glycosyltransferase involved in cell wall biosynthesis
MAKKGERVVNILGIRGLPAAHGGFETFAAGLAPYLRDRGWTVNVYCQIDPDKDGNLRPDFEDEWEGIHRIHIGTSKSGSSGSVVFDWRCVRDVLRRPGVDLVLGYNTAIFSILQRLRGRRFAMNMDGIEWRRAKWSVPIKAWFYLNEFIGANVCTIPVADHPEIKKHLHRHGCSRAVVIPYGSETIGDVASAPVTALGLEPNRYLVSIARIEPENSILEMVRTFSAQPRGLKLVVLGKFEDGNEYHQKVKRAASDEVYFPGAIYDKSVVTALRRHALAYMHGHQVGGTNPSLVEALGAGNAVIAHDNRFNRWVAGNAQFFFADDASLNAAIIKLAHDPAAVDAARGSAKRQHEEKFLLDSVHAQYVQILEKLIA